MQNKIMTILEIPCQTLLTQYEKLFISVINTTRVVLACEQLSMHHAMAPINADNSDFIFSLESYRRFSL